MPYDESKLDCWTGIVNRQRAKDELFLTRIAKYFRKGDILEIGAGCGQLSVILASRGYQVVATDLQPCFVQYMESKQGLTSSIVDATEISSHIDKKFDNIITQGLSTLINTDTSNIARTYQSVFESLQENGRFIFIFPNAYKSKRYSTIKTHINIIRDTQFNIVRIFRDQILPSPFYGVCNKKAMNLAESCFGRYFGIRNVIVLEKPS